MSKKYKVEKDQRYRCRIKLNFIEAFAGNNLIQGKLERVGFKDVKVAGDGNERHAVGTWNFETVTTYIPSQIVEIEKIGRLH